MAHILIVDDDPVQLDLRKSFLESQEHEVSMAFSVRQTMRALEARTPDLVILDLRFPNAVGESDSGEGLALIRLIRDLNGRIPILVLSGWPADLDGHPEEKLVTRVLLKPVKSCEFMQAVQELIA
jgi:CheY-like chemotaxis protein